MPTYAYKMSKHFKKRSGGRKTNKKISTTNSTVTWRDSLVCLREKLQRDAARRSKSVTSLIGERAAAQESTLDLRAAAHSAPSSLAVMERAVEQWEQEADDWARFMAEVPLTDWIYEEERAADEADYDWLSFVATPPMVITEERAAEDDTDDWLSFVATPPTVVKEEEPKGPVSVSDRLMREEWAAEQTSPEELRKFLNDVMDLEISEERTAAQQVVPKETTEAVQPEFNDWTFWMPRIDDVPQQRAAEQSRDWTNWLPPIENKDSEPLARAAQQEDRATSSYSVSSVLENEHFGVCGCSFACSQEFTEPATLTSTSNMSTDSTDFSALSTDSQPEKEESSQQSWMEDANRWLMQKGGLPIIIPTGPAEQSRYTDFLEAAAQSAKKAMDEKAADQSDWTEFLDEIVNRSAGEASERSAAERCDVRAAEQKWEEASLEWLDTFDADDVWTMWLSEMSNAVDVFDTHESSDPGSGASCLSGCGRLEMMAVSSSSPATWAAEQYTISPCAPLTHQCDCIAVVGGAGQHLDWATRAASQSTLSETTIKWAAEQSDWVDFLDEHEPELKTSFTVVTEVSDKEAALWDLSWMNWVVEQLRGGRFNDDVIKAAQEHRKKFGH